MERGTQERDRTGQDSRYDKYKPIIANRTTGTRLMQRGEKGKRMRITRERPKEEERERERERCDGREGRGQSIRSTSQEKGPGVVRVPCRRRRPRPGGRKWTRGEDVRDDVGVRASSSRGSTVEITIYF